MEYGKNLLEFRAKYNLTQKDLAELFEVSPNMVFRYEKGTHKPHKANEIRFENKMKEYEVKQNELQM